MLWIKGDMFSYASSISCKHIGFTANAYVTKDGRLVMGAGAAKRTQSLIPGIQYLFGATISPVGV